MRKTLISFLISFIAASLSGEKIIQLGNLMNPGQIFVDKTKNEIFITDRTTINIYSMGNFVLKNKFGKAGEGPGEFQRSILINVQPEYILVNSRNKVSFFSRESSYIKEKKVTSGKRFVPMGNRFVGQGFKVIGQTGFETFNLYDQEMIKGEEIAARKSPIQSSGKIPVLKTPFFFRVYKNKIYYTVENGFEIYVADSEGKKRPFIKQNYKLRKFKEKDKLRFENYFRTNPRTKKNYEILKQRLEYPGYFPAIRTIKIADDLIYVITYKKEKDNLSELYIFDLKGKLIKKASIHIVEMNTFRPFPFSISEGKIYQVIETEDEHWELHITTI